MLKRTITGACYVAVIVGMFFLREYVDARLMNVLIWLFMGVGTFELARAIEPFAMKGTFWVAVVYGIIIVPLYCLIEYVLFDGLGWVVTVIISFSMVIFYAGWSVVKNQKDSAYLTSLLPFFYPSFFLLTTILANELPEYGFVALLLIFVIAPCADTSAYLVGMGYNKLKKGQAKKLCPKLSPKKTVAGAIGGVIGGGLGSMIIYFIVKPQVNVFSPVLFFIIIGLVSAVLTTIGDLFESYIKRKTGIKDSGKILPGHGGVLDRIDGMLFSSVFIFLVFLLI